MKREFSAGGIVYKIQNSNDKHQKPVVFWLVRRPAAGAEYKGNLGWSFPKGWIDKGETPEQAAVREVAEEGGVAAKMVRKLPTFKIFFTDKDGEKVMKFITYFVMEYTADVPGGPGWETAEARWVTKGEAIKMLAFKNERELVKLAGE